MMVTVYSGGKSRLMVASPPCSGGGCKKEEGTLSSNDGCLTVPLGVSCVSEDERDDLAPASGSLIARGFHLTLDGLRSLVCDATEAARWRSGVPPTRGVVVITPEWRFWQDL